MASVSARTKSPRASKRKLSATSRKRPAKPKPIPAGYGVFLEHEYAIDEPMEPILLRRTENKFEAIGWSDCWHVDDSSFLNAKMVLRPIDADGKPIADSKGKAVQHG